MPDHFEAMTDALFEGPLSVEVTYTPQGGASFALRIVPDMADGLIDAYSAALVSQALTFRAKVADLPVPEAGDMLTMNGQSFTVQGASDRGPRRQWWNVQARPS